MVKENKMEISLNESEYCRLQIDYEVGLEEIENKRAEVLTLFRKAPVPGFRPNKATLDSIKIYYHSQIEESLKRALAEEAYHNVLFEKGIKPLGTPNFTSILLSKDKFSCSFSLSKKPEFDLSEYKNFEIPKPVAEDPVVLAEKMIQDLRVQHGNNLPFEENDFVQMGDNIIIDYEASSDGQKVDVLCATGELLTVGNSQFPAFDNNLLGMKVGETREFNITLDEKIQSPLAGKVLCFKVTVNMGSKVAPMPLNDELAVKVGKKDLQDLLQQAAGTASARVTEFARAETLKQISARLVENHDFKVPDWLSLSEAQYLAHNSRLTWDTLSDDTRQQYLGMAEKNVKLGLVLDKIRDNEPEAQLSDQEVIDIIKRNINKSESEMDTVLQGMNKNGYLPILVARIRDEHTLDFILKNSKIVE